MYKEKGRAGWTLASCVLQYTKHILAWASLQQLTPLIFSMSNDFPRSWKGK